MIGQWVRLGSEQRRPAASIYQSQYSQSPVQSFLAKTAYPVHTNDINDVGRSAYVRGRIQSDGSLLASLVVIGDVLKVKGTATEAVSRGPIHDDPRSIPGAGRDLCGGGLGPESIILIDCDTPVDSSYIQPGVRTTVIGKYDINALLLRAAAVIVESRVTTGQLTQIDSVVGGSNLTIQPATGSPSIVFLPASQNVYLQGDGVVDLEPFERPLPMQQHSGPCSSGHGNKSPHHRLPKKYT